MRRLIVIGLVTVLWATAATALTAEQKCYSGRAKAKAKYEECVGKWLAKVYAGADITTDAVQSKLSKCREKYAKAWDKLVVLATAPCNGSRFADNGSTVTDKLTGLVWEKKTDDATTHDKDNPYSWTAVDADNTDADGTAFTNFLANLNAGGGFAGTNDWRLPMLPELLTLFDKPYPCTTAPCIDAAFGLTKSHYYFSATADASESNNAWRSSFINGYVAPAAKAGGGYVRAVRGGL